ncbi:MAG TPA: alpha/beta fold hydrolase [Dongiaceae bacterium]|nr:alpha/beta fold hydrolase [Dongiaceae bacterium]
MKSVLRFLGKVALLLACCYVGICVTVYFIQETLLYHPDRAMPSPQEAGMANTEIVHLKTSDGENLVAWWIPPRTPDKPVILYLHGNGGNISYRTGRFSQITADGSGLLALSWRGFGTSTGTPTEAGLMTDARTAYDYLKTKTTPDHIVLMGESLGTGIAVHLATEVPVNSIILDSAYSSILDIAETRFDWLPVSLLLRDQYQAIAMAKSVQVRVYQVHCVGDPLIPIRFARALNAQFPNHAELIEAPGGYHPVSAAALDAVLTEFREQYHPGT